MSEAEKDTHEVRIETRGMRGFGAQCSCGWTSPTSQSNDMAEMHGDVHRSEAEKEKEEEMNETLSDQVKRMEDSLRAILALAQGASRTVRGDDGKSYPCNGDNLGRIEVSANYGLGNGPSVSS